MPDEFNSSLGDKKERELLAKFFDTKNIVVIGIGGSLEGPKMLMEFLASSDPNKNFFRTAQMMLNLVQKLQA